VAALAPVVPTGFSLTYMDRSSQPASSDRLLAAGGIVGGLVAASCCVLPLGLVTLGIGGAWMSRLTALAPYKPYTLAAAGLLLGVGFWHTYWRPAKACEPGSLCAVPASRRFTKAALWAGAGLVALSASVDLWAPFFW
jgi:mercuric ion transport protein